MIPKRIIHLSSTCLKNTIRRMSSEGDRGVTLDTLVDFLEKFAPVSLAEKWDNTGLLLEPSSKHNVSSILLTNDLTENVVQEALLVKADLIISYHPPIFEPLKRITCSTWKERIIGTCLENKIAVYSPHTSWDSVPGGVNDWLASAFDYTNVIPILKQEGTEIEMAGAGRYCQLKEEITLSKAVNNIKNLIAQAHVQIALGRNVTLESKIKDVAICAGSGGSVFQNFQSGLYVTGEMSHHTLLDKIHKGSSVIVCNHSNSERGFLRHFKEKLDKTYLKENIQTFVSKEDRDPLQFV